MKNIAIILLIGIILGSCTGKKDSFKITGTVKGVDTGLVYLQKFESDQWINSDSVRLVKGEFTFTGKVDLPEMRHILVPANQIMLPLFVENSTIVVQLFPDSVDKSTITGSASQDLYKQYISGKEAIETKSDTVYQNWKKAKETHDTVGMARYDSISNILDGELKKQLVDFIKSNNKTNVASYLMVRNTWQFELPELEELVNAMDTTLNSSTYLQAMKMRVEILKSVAIGQPAPDFEMNDSTGTPVKLSSLKGKYLLVDFWASWCGPCRAENPNVVKAWKAYNTKGFDVLGVSLDENREKWLKAVNADNLTWTHVSDLKRWGNAAGKLYGISSIPANVLLDKDQKIIARDLRGEALMSKLSELLGPPAGGKKK